MDLYPLTFKTIFKDKIWGGDKIKTILDKDFTPLPNCGETWELSGVEGNVSLVSKGALENKALTELVSHYGGELVGKKVYERFGDDFPLLVKFIDANDDLSIQVHPNDEIAIERHQSFGKSEMWYIMQADEEARLINGFNKTVGKDEYVRSLNEGHLNDILNFEHVSVGDHFFVPAGRVHSIGKGILLAEIQQTSDVTYRIYDFDRVDQNGEERELHTDLALDVMDYNRPAISKTNYDHGLNKSEELVKCPYFTTNRLFYDRPVKRAYDELDSFVIYVCVEGSCTLKCKDQVELKKGEVVLIPACFDQVELIPKEEVIMLESYLEL